MSLQLQHHSVPVSQIFPDEIMVRENQNPEISGMSLDSRSIKPKDLFVARVGFQKDGRSFIDDAIKKGASVILSEERNHEGFYLHKSGCPVYCHENLGPMLGEMASRFYQTNEQNQKIIAVTGTNGKTSICHFLAQALETCGYKVAVLGTAGNGFLSRLEESALTTLDVLSLHKKISELAVSGADYICMEVSSHSLVQGRVDGLHFECAIFSNLSQDHLDYHQSMEAYEEAKSLLFKTQGLKKAVIRFDKAGERISADLSDDIKVYLLGSGNTESFLALPVNNSVASIDVNFEFEGEQCRIQNSYLFGQFNIENLLLCFLSLKQLGIETKKACDALCEVKAVKGRLQKIIIDKSSGNLPEVFVDFAHSPESLEKVLQSLRLICKGRLILVFGCGGDRDKGKRKLMAKVAEQYSDFVFVTSDNPRTESQHEITGQITAGFSDTFLEKVFIEEDRELAIERAMFSSEKMDVVLVAGKGHEQYQLIGDKKYFFSDQAVVERILSEMGGLQ